MTELSMHSMHISLQSQNNSFAFIKRSCILERQAQEHLILQSPEISQENFKHDMDWTLGVRTAINQTHQNLSKIELFDMLN